jgi:ectoine hydroxylase-related dioxygenase (phytanoyl-CoA dioxygenase family)
VLTPAQLAALDRDGFTVVPGALDAAWLERLRLAFSHAPAQRDGTQHVALAADTPELAAWTALKEHPVVLAAAQHVLGPSFHVRDLHGRNPLPGFGQQGLHADWMERADGAQFFVVTAIWMIDAFTTDNGATRLVPGTHRLPRAVPKSLAQPSSVHPEERVATGDAGSVLVFNGHTWHAGRRNQSGGPRRAGQMVIQRGT